MFFYDTWHKCIYFKLCDIFVFLCLRVKSEGHRPGQVGKICILWPVGEWLELDRRGSWLLAKWLWNTQFTQFSPTTRSPGYQRITNRSLGLRDWGFGIDCTVTDSKPQQPLTTDWGICIFPLQLVVSRWLLISVLACVTGAHAVLFVPGLVHLYVLWMVRFWGWIYDYSTLWKLYV